MESNNWKEIEGYEGLYKINPEGIVYRIDKNKIVKYNNHSHGYFYVTLYKNNKRRNFLVHRLLAIYFISNTENKCCVNHIDGDVKNFKLENLEWCTYSENNKHAYDIGLHKPHNKKVNLGSKSVNAKISELQAIEIFNSEGTQKSIAKKYGISQTQVFRIKKNQRWGHVIK